MPEASLQALYQETQASNLKAYLVLRGLQDGSIRKTAETLKRLKIAVQIDPSLFERYAITVVPTFVWIRGSEVHRVSGHLRLTDAVRRLTEGS